jgi:hypothetical protein
MRLRPVVRPRTIMANLTSVLAKSWKTEGLKQN